MAAKKRQKYVWGFGIITTSELEEKIYFAPEITIEGSFVRFKPQIELGKCEKKLKDCEYILPERVIKEIIYQRVIDDVLKVKKLWNP
jgi:hypothetical protein